MPTFTAGAPVAEPQKPGAAGRGRARKWAFAAATLALLGAAAAILWGARRTPGSEFESFWEPLFRERKPIQICIGQPTRLYRLIGPRSEELNRLFAGPASPERNTTNLSIAAGEVAWVAPEYLFLRDALSAFKVASWIQSKDRVYQLTPVSQTNYSRLRHLPLVAIVAFNNPWSMRVAAELRFVFDSRTVDGITYHYVNDRHNPNAPYWRVAQPAGGAMTEDYAIVSVRPGHRKDRDFSGRHRNVWNTRRQRVHHRAGVSGRGAPGGSEGLAPQERPIRVGCENHHGTPRPPRILATHFW
jgi:hypothetical protein